MGMIQQCKVNLAVLSREGGGGGGGGGGVGGKLGIPKKEIGFRP